jgi:hypothetical protein
MLEIFLLFVIFLIWAMKGPKESEMLSNGCLPSGHNFSSYGMCKICGHYE